MGHVDGGQYGAEGVRVQEDLGGVRQAGPWGQAAGPSACALQGSRDAGPCRACRTHMELLPVTVWVGEASVARALAALSPYANALGAGSGTAGQGGGSTTGGVDSSSPDCLGLEQQHQQHLHQPHAELTLSVPQVGVCVRKQWLLAPSDATLCCLAPCVWWCHELVLHTCINAAKCACVHVNKPM